MIKPILSKFIYRASKKSGLKLGSKSAIYDCLKIKSKDFDKYSHKETLKVMKQGCFKMIELEWDYSRRMKSNNFVNKLKSFRSVKKFKIFQGFRPQYAKTFLKWILKCFKLELLEFGGMVDTKSMAIFIKILKNNIQLKSLRNYVACSALTQTKILNYIPAFLKSLANFRELEELEFGTSRITFLSAFHYDALFESSEQFPKLKKLTVWFDRLQAAKQNVHFFSIISAILSKRPSLNYLALNIELACEEKDFKLLLESISTLTCLESLILYFSNRTYDENLFLLEKLSNLKILCLKFQIPKNKDLVSGMIDMISRYKAMKALTLKIEILEYLENFDYSLFSKIERIESFNLEIDNSSMAHFDSDKISNFNMAFQFLTSFSFTYRARHHELKNFGNLITALHLLPEVKRINIVIESEIENLTPNLELITLELKNSSFLSKLVEFELRIEINKEINEKERLERATLDLYQTLKSRNIFKIKIKAFGCKFNQNYLR